MKRGDYSEACDKFEQSEELAQAPGTLLNLAACSEKLGRLATAVQSLRAARDLLPATDTRIGYVKQQIAELEPRVPRITIQLDKRRQGATVSINDEEVSLEKLSEPVELNPGRHVVTLSVRGHETSVYPVTVEEGSSKTLVVRPGNAQRAPGSARDSSEPVSASTARAEGETSQSSSAPSSESSGKRTAGYVALASGGLGLVVGTVAGIVVLNNKSTMESHCDDTFACDSTGLDAASAGETFSAISTVAFVVAGAGVGLGAYLLLSDDGDSGSAVGLVPNQRGVDVALRGRF